MREFWFYHICEKHGRQPHLTILDGMCEECAKERIDLTLADKRKDSLAKKMRGCSLMDKAADF